ncbi:acyl-CoA dehydrogenase family protein [Nocardioides bruguierae]|uniref:acyl-CoA dehydrogenase family protein n=1 Tax=Nocardioides bruguierae TaxID=2945102 RepID=UPI00201FCC1F|nr:acyl-CoA dehydrogenase family protein [Nocardioides bruguierae]MCL8025247.1 acyl-CoA dehydrogenase family protein [Nocardioides bruguierae]
MTASTTRTSGSTATRGTTGFELSREHEEFRRTVAEFAAARVAPFAGQWDRERRFPLETVREMGELGLFGLTTPEDLGGAGGDLTSLCVAIEEIGRADQSLGITLEAAVGLGIAPLLRFGTRAQQEAFVPDLAAGRALAAFGLTEPGAGSDAGATRTRARLEGADDGGRSWVLDGAKQFITNSGTEITSLVTVTARTGERPDGSPEISAVMVPAGTPGLEVGPAYDKLGWHASDTHPLSLVDCRVPEENLLGERGRGYAQFLATLDEGRIAIAALAVGSLQACLDAALVQVREREVAGVPIGARQAVAFQVADLEAWTTTARVLTYRAAALADAGRPAAEVKQAAAIAKLTATEHAVAATRVATQLLGGYGFMEEHPMARFYRDAKVLEVGEGTSEVQRLVLARGLGLPVSW